MEYPFKDLLPLDEVLEREGYYKDWTHLDPEVFYSLTQISEYIKTKGFGVDVRLLIAQLAEHFGLKTTQVINLANLLQRNFENLEGVTQSFTNNINSLVAQMEADKNAVIANVTVDSEVILARGGKATLGQRLDETTAQLAQTNARLKDIKSVNVKDFGAKDIYADGNLNFDSTLAFQSAIDYALDPTTEGGKLFIPSGTYNISEELIIPKTLQIEGVSERSYTTVDGVSKSLGSAIIQTGGNKSIFKFTGDCYGVEISQLFLRADKYGIEVVDNITFSEFIFEKIHFNGNFEACLRLRGSIGRISDCDFSSGGSHKYGIDMIHATSVWIENNNFWQCSQAHINFTNATDVHILNNWFEYTNRTCLLLQSPCALDKVTVSNCEFHAGQGTAMEFDAITYPTDIFAIRDLLIDKCRLSSQLSSLANEAIKIRVKGATNPNNSYTVKIRDSTLSNVKQCGITTDIPYTQMVLENVKAFHQFSYSDAPVIVGVGDVVPAARQYKLGNRLTLNSGIQFEPKANEGWVDNLLYLSAASDKLTFRKNSSTADTRQLIMALNRTVPYSDGTTTADLKQNIDEIMTALRECGLIN